LATESARTTVQRAIKDDLLLPTVQTKMQDFDARVKEKFNEEQQRETSSCCWIDFA